MNDTDALWDAIRELRGQLDTANERIHALEAMMPGCQAAELEADLAAADLAESGYG